MVRQDAWVQALQGHATKKQTHRSCPANATPFVEDLETNIRDKTRPVKLLTAIQERDFTEEVDSPFIL